MFYSFLGSMCGGLPLVAFWWFFEFFVKIKLCNSIGGTGDITIHEVQSDQSLHEKSMATGGAWGGNKINEAFLDIWKDILGKSQD